MITTVWLLRIAQSVVVASIGVGVAGAAKLTPQQCYKEDSECTQFCGDVTGNLRYECFGICDRMLDNCLGSGEWDDSPLDVDPGNPPDKGGRLSGLLLRMLMVMADENSDGSLPLKEVQSLKDKVEASGVKVEKAPTAPKQQ
jgi:hypothetical protein